LLPFAKECEASCPGTVVQEDNAPAHAHHHQQTIYNLHNVKRLLWCPNSPDLNMIEPAWFYLKRVTTKLGAPKSRTEAIRVWKKAWAELSQQRIRGWVERIVRHIKEVIRLDGGNEYKEGRGENSIN
jgi:siroheme synthase